MRKLIVSMIDLIICHEGHRRPSIHCCSRQISESAKNVSFGRLRRTVPPAPNAIKHAFPTANKLAI
jgi:hypothetical protein